MKSISPQYRREIIALMEAREEVAVHDALRAAYDEWTRTAPHYARTRFAPPIRSNQPCAGDPSYEPHSPLPRIDWAQVRFVAAVGLFVIGVWAAVIVLVWRQVTG